MHELQARGYRKIGFAMEEDQDNRVQHNWRGGFLSALPDNATRRAAPFLLTPEWTRERFSRWFEEDRPDAIVTTGPEVEQWLHDLGLSIPEEVGLAHLNINPGMSHFTGIDQQSTQVGYASVDLLLSLMRYNDRGIPAVPSAFMVEGKFQAGQTTRSLSG